MISFLLSIGKLYWKPLVGAALILGVVLTVRHLWVESVEEEVYAAVEAERGAARVAAAERLREAEEEVEKVRLEYEAIRKEESRVLQEQLAAVDGSNRDLARRLRDHQRRLGGCGSAVSEAAGAADGAAPAPGESGDQGEAGTAVELALENHLAACGRDGERLTGWQRWWERAGTVE